MSAHNHRAWTERTPKPVNTTCPFCWGSGSTSSGSYAAGGLYEHTSICRECAGRGVITVEQEPIDSK